MKAADNGNGPYGRVSRGFPTGFPARFPRSRPMWLILRGLIPPGLQQTGMLRFSASGVNWSLSRVQQAVDEQPSLAGHHQDTPHSGGGIPVMDVWSLEVTEAPGDQGGPAPRFPSIPILVEFRDPPPSCVSQLGRIGD